MRLGIGMGLGFGGPAAAFSPKDVTGLALWIDAAKGITKSGANVTTWADQSGAGFDLNAQDAANAFNAAGAPNALPCVDFSLGALYRASGLIAGADAARTIFIVSKTTVTATAQVPVVDGALASGGFGYIQNETGISKRAVYLPGIAFETDTTSDLSTGWEQVCIINRGTAGAAGSQRIREARAEHTLDAANNAPSASTGSFSIGGAHGFASLKFVGSIAELLVYAGELSPSNATKIETYLNIKYGV